MNGQTHSHASMPGVRVRHYQGERLQAADLHADDAQATAMRQLHVRTLHDAWGVALGLDVYLDSGAEFVVASGLAYDRLGREILLSAPLIAPALRGDQGDGVYQLVVALSDSGEPCLRWHFAGHTQLGLEVPLVAVTLAQGALDLSSFDFSVRPYAQPLTRPHIAYGLTTAEQRWRIWRKAGGERELGFGLRVDTSSAGFVGTPLYVASLQMSGGGLFFGNANAAQVQMYVFGSLANATPTGFTFRLVIAGLPPPTTPPPSGSAAPKSVQDVFKRFATGQLPFQVAWTGIEPVEAFAPSGL